MSRRPVDAVGDRDLQPVGAVGQDVGLIEVVKPTAWSSAAMSRSAMSHPGFWSWRRRPCSVVIDCVSAERGNGARRRVVTGPHDYNGNFPEQIKSRNSK